MLAEQDCVFLSKPPPNQPDFFATFAGVCPKSWNVKATKFWHPPYWMNRATANRVLEKADRLLESGDYENGSPDVFFGRVIDELGITPITVGTWCCNSEDLEQKMPELRWHMKQGGLWFVHGVRTKQQFEEITQLR